MLIDGFTVIAEIVNFLILIFLLQRVLYKPLLNIMDAREQKIAKTLREAAEKQLEAEEEAAQYRQARHDVDKQRDAVLAKARAEADAYRQERMEKARQEAAAAQVRWQADVAREQTSFLHDLRQRTTHEVVRVSQRVLKQLASADLERQTINAFVKHIGQLEGDDVDALRRLASTPGQAIQARSAFEMPQHERQAVVDALRQRLGENVEVTFDVAPDLGFGIELQANGHKLAWSLNSHVQALEESVAAALHAQIEQAHDSDDHDSDDKE